MEKVAKYICLIGLSLAVSGPLLKEHTALLDSYLEAEPLLGYFPPVDEVEVSLSSWWSGQLQSQVEPHLKRHLKVRPFAVRVNNQMRYDLLQELRPDIIEGKESYLFQNSYLEDLAGLRYVGDEMITDQARKLKYLAKALKAKYDTEVILAIAPSKAMVQFEKLPTHYHTPDTARTNYAAYKEALKGTEVHVIDYNQYFKELNKDTEHIISTKNGIHWSQYGAILAADSLTRYMGELLGKDTPPIDLSEVVQSTSPRDTDEDLAESLNFLQPISSETYSYFNNYLPHPDSTVGHKPEVMLIGDSFCWTVWSSHIPSHAWGSTSKFLYYFNEIYPVFPTDYGDQTVPDLVLDFVEEAEVVVLLYNPMTMDKLGSTFIDTMYELETAAAK